jgi:hypothetical protein
MGLCTSHTNSKTIYQAQGKKAWGGRPPHVFKKLPASKNLIKD